MGMIFGFANDVMQAKAQGAQAQIQAQQGKLNRQYANQSAQTALAAGDQQAARAQIKGGQIIGQAQSELGASGVDASSGSAVDALADSRMMSSYDAATIRNNAAREAWGYQVRGEQAYTQGQIDSGRSLDEMKGTILGAGPKFASSAIKTLMPAKTKSED